MKNVLKPKDADRVVNCVDPDQTGHCSFSLIWIYIFCPDFAQTCLSKLRNITVVYKLLRMESRIKLFNCLFIFSFKIGQLEKETKFLLVLEKKIVWFDKTFSQYCPMYYEEHFSFEPPLDKTDNVVCVPSEDSDQPGHPPSLIRVFAVRMKKAWVLSYPLSAQRRLWSNWADAQADLSFRWVHTHFVGFVTRRLIFLLLLTHIWLVDFSSPFKWRSPFPNLGVSGVFLFLS